MPGAEARGTRLRRFPPQAATGWAAVHLAEALTQLDPTADEQRQARQALLAQLSSQNDAYVAIQLAHTMAFLEPTEYDRDEARKELLRLLQGESAGLIARQLADMLAELAVTPAERHQARDALIQLLTRQVPRRVAKPPADTTAQEQFKALLMLLDNRAGCEVAAAVSGAVARLDPTPEDKQMVREALLPMLLCPLIEEAVRRVVSAAKDEQQAREQIRLRLPARRGSRKADNKLVNRIIRLVSVKKSESRPHRMAPLLCGQLIHFEPSADDKRAAREVLIMLLVGQTDESAAEETANTMAQLDPAVRDLDTWQNWAAIPPEALLSEVRRNSPLTEWLAALPTFPH